MRLLAVLAAGIFCISGTALGQVYGFDDPELDARYRELIHSIRCMKCQNQSIADSPVDVAADLRRETFEMMQAGMSDEEIRNFITSRYGDFSSYTPPFKASTWLLWLGPGLLMIVGGFVFARLVRTRMNQPLDEELE